MVRFPVSGRPVRAYINRNAFRHNLELAESLAKPAQALVVLKADAYGHGMLEMAAAAGTRHFAVASSDEASRLIQAGFKNPIWVLEGPFDHSCLQRTQSHPIHWVVHSLWQLELLARHQDFQPFKVWLKLDTGMHRLGLSPDELDLALEKISALESTELVGVFTHFASSESPDRRTTDCQKAEFENIIASRGLGSLAQSMANSAGILRHDDSHRQWVRPGIMLYGGIRACDSAHHPQKAVMRLCSAVMALRKVPKGDSVGYGGTWTAARDSLVATVAIGYGDGYPRHAPNGTPVLVAGRRAPLVGRVSMDMITVDVSELESVRVGDEVELWGQDLPAEEVAASADTISYTLFTGITARVPKIYSDD